MTDTTTQAHTRPAPTTDPIVMLARIVTAHADSASAAFESLALGQDVILRRLERLEQLLADRESDAANQPTDRTPAP